MTLLRPAGMSWPALDQLHDLAVKALDRHTTSGGICRACGTPGVCEDARLAANNLDMSASKYVAPDPTTPTRLP